MAGLEVLFASAAPAITCAQDALVCFLHWEVVTHGYYGLGAGDQVRHGARVAWDHCGGGRRLLPESGEQRPGPECPTFPLRRSGP